MLLLTLTAVIDHLPRGAIRWLLALIREQLSLFLLVALFLGIGWLFAGRGLRGLPLVRWCLVPILVAVALFCVVGPDRLFPKEPFEGPHLITLSATHALTFLDLPGFAAAFIAGALGLWSIRGRLRVDARR